MPVHGGVQTQLTKHGVRMALNDFSSTVTAHGDAERPHSNVQQIPYVKGSGQHISYSSALLLGFQKFKYMAIPLANQESSTSITFVGFQFGNS